MREGIKTSLLSILCVAATSAAFAAPTVRMVGGNGTYESAAAATAASRAGSLRSTGGYIRPTTSTSGTTLNAATTPATTTATAPAGGSVSAGGMATNRVASSPRLSIGKYIGAPKSVSTSGGTGSDLTERVEKLERNVDKLETDKQDAIQDSTYIYMQGDQVVLDLDRVREDLDLPQGARDIEFSDDETGLYWNYVDDTEDHLVMTWAAMRERLGIGDIDGMITERINELKTELADTYVALDQGDTNAGKVLVVGDDGIVAPTELDIPDTNDFYTKDDVDDIVDDIDDELDKKLDKDQGDTNAGKVLVVGDDGIVTPTELDIDVSGKLDKNVGTTGEPGDIMVVDDNGDIVPANIDDALADLGDLAFQDMVGAGQLDSGIVTTETLADKAVERAKLADDITKTLSGVDFWEQWWNEHKDELESGDYVVAVTPGTNASNPPQLFRVISADND